VTLGAQQHEAQKRTGVAKSTIAAPATIEEKATGASQILIMSLPSFLPV